MARKKIYRDEADRIEQFRQKKKAAGMRAVQVYVPEAVYVFIQRQPARLLKAFLEYAKLEYIEFSRVTSCADGSLILGNGEGATWELKENSWDAGRVKDCLKENPSAVFRLYPNGDIRPQV